MIQHIRHHDGEHLYRFLGETMMEGIFHDYNCGGWNSYGHVRVLGETNINSMYSYYSLDEWALTVEDARLLKDERDDKRKKEMEESQRQFELCCKTFPIYRNYKSE